jgi:putative ABC transport system permease protein
MTWQNVRLSVRALAKRPGFTAAAVLTLALGIGANTAIFSVVNAVILRPYAFPDLDRLVLVREGGNGATTRQGRLAPADAIDLAQESSIFSGATSYRYRQLNLTAGGDVRPVQGCTASAGFFGVLGAQPALGRGFLRGEDEHGRDDVVVLSHGLWNRLGADPGLVGKTLELDGRPHTVVGVMSRGFDYPAAVEAWVPLTFSPEERAERVRKTTFLLGRLAPHLTMGQADAALQSVARRLELEHPQTAAGRTLTLLRLREELYQYTVPIFSLLQAAAGFLLFLAGANLTNLLFARLVGRERELAIRTALGESRTGLAGVLLTETVLLSVLAGAIATAVSVATVELIRTSISTEYTKWVPGWDRMRVDGTVLVVTLALVVALGILFGVASALYSSRTEPAAALKQGGAATSGGSRKGRLRAALVAGQVALAMILLVGAGLMTNGFRRLTRVYGGFDPASVLTLQVAVPEPHGPDPARVLAFQDELVRKLAALPEVRSVGLASNLPASNVNNPRTPFTIEGRPALKAAEAPVADLQIASAGFFPTLAIPVLDGRGLSEQDGPDSQSVAVVSRAMAARFWPDASPLGQRIALGGSASDQRSVTVVGVVGDVKQNWWDPQPRPTLYLPHRQLARAWMNVAVRTTSDPLGSVPAIRAAVQGIDPEVALRDVQPMDRLVADSLAIVRVMGTLMTAFGAVALALSALGVYGVVAHAVARRTQEFGTRMAFGATPTDILKLVMGQVLWLSGIGLLVGLPVAAALSQAAASLVFGVVTVELPVLAGFAAALLLVGLAAGLVPAWRATRVDPLVALRCE